jgi:hypothetical protein
MMSMIGVWKEMARASGFHELRNDESRCLLGVEGVDGMIVDKGYR